MPLQSSPSSPSTSRCAVLSPNLNCVAVHSSSGAASKDCDFSLWPVHNSLALSDVAPTVAPSAELRTRCTCPSRAPVNTSDAGSGTAGVTRFCFSHNGWLLATLCTSALVCLWDCREPTNSACATMAAAATAASKPASPTSALCSAPTAAGRFGRLLWSSRAQALRAARVGSFPSPMPNRSRSVSPSWGVPITEAALPAPPAVIKIDCEQHEQRASMVASAVTSSSSSIVTTLEGATPSDAGMHPFLTPPGSFAASNNRMMASSNNSNNATTMVTQMPQQKEQEEQQQQQQQHSDNSDIAWSFSFASGQPQQLPDPTAAVPDYVDYIINNEAPPSLSHHASPLSGSFAAAAASRAAAATSRAVSRSSARLMSVAFSGDDLLLGVGCSDGLVHFWDLSRLMDKLRAEDIREQQTKRRRGDGDEDDSRNCDLPSYNQNNSSNSNRRANDASPYASLVVEAAWKQLRLSAAVTAVALSESGSYCATATADDFTVRVFDLTAVAQFNAKNQGATNASRLAAASPVRGSISLGERSTTTAATGGGRVVGRGSTGSEPPTPVIEHAVVRSASSANLSICSQQAIPFGGAGSSSRGSGGLLRSFRGHIRAVSSLVFEQTPPMDSDLPMRLASASRDGTVRVWSFRPDEQVQQRTRQRQSSSRNNNNYDNIDYNSSSSNVNTKRNNTKNKNSFAHGDSINGLSLSTMVGSSNEVPTAAGGGTGAPKFVTLVANAEQHSCSSSVSAAAAATAIPPTQRVRQVQRLLVDDCSLSALLPSSQEDVSGVSGAPSPLLGRSGDGSSADEFAPLPSGGTFYNRSTGSSLANSKSVPNDLDEHASSPATATASTEVPAPPATVTVRVYPSDSCLVLEVTLHPRHSVTSVAFHQPERRAARLGTPSFVGGNFFGAEEPIASDMPTAMAMMNRSGSGLLHNQRHRISGARNASAAATAGADALYSPTLQQGGLAAQLRKRSLIGATCTDGTMSIFDGMSGRLLYSLDCVEEEEEEVEANPLTPVPAATPSAHHPARSSSLLHRFVSLRERSRREQSRRQQQSRFPPMSIVFQREGRFAACINGKGTIRVLSLETAAFAFQHALRRILQQSAAAPLTRITLLPAADAHAAALRSPARRRWSNEGSSGTSDKNKNIYKYKSKNDSVDVSTDSVVFKSPARSRIPSLHHSLGDPFMSPKQQQFAVQRRQSTVLRRCNQQQQLLQWQMQLRRHTAANINSAAPLFALANAQRAAAAQVARLEGANNTPLENTTIDICANGKSPAAAKVADRPLFIETLRHGTRSNSDQPHISSHHQQVDGNSRNSRNSNNNSPIGGTSFLHHGVGGGSSEKSESGCLNSTDLLQYRSQDDSINDTRRTINSGRNSREEEGGNYDNNNGGDNATHDDYDDDDDHDDDDDDDDDADEVGDNGEVIIIKGANVVEIRQPNLMNTLGYNPDRAAPLIAGSALERSRATAGTSRAATAGVMTSSLTKLSMSKYEVVAPLRNGQYGSVAIVKRAQLKPHEVEMMQRLQTERSAGTNWRRSRMSVSGTQHGSGSGSGSVSSGRSNTCGSEAALPGKMGTSASKIAATVVCMSVQQQQQQPQPQQLLMNDAAETSVSMPDCVAPQLIRSETAQFASTTQPPSAAAFASISVPPDTLRILQEQKTNGQQQQQQHQSDKSPQQQQFFQKPKPEEKPAAPAPPPPPPPPQELYVQKTMSLRKGTDAFSSRMDADIMSNCVHPFIVAYVEQFESLGNLNLIMEYASGGDLGRTIESMEEQHKQQMQRGEKSDNGGFFDPSGATGAGAVNFVFPAEKLLLVFTETCLAVDYMHRHGMMHKDIKPQNVLLDADGFAKLTDFGFSMRVNSEYSSQADAKGTPRFIAPEIWHQLPHGTPVDVWALGIMFYLLLASRHPFVVPDSAGGANNLARLSAIVIGEPYSPLPPPRSGSINGSSSNNVSYGSWNGITNYDLSCDPAVHQIVDAMLQKAPARRATVSQVLATLEKRFGAMSKVLQAYEEKFNRLLSAQQQQQGMDKNGVAAQAASGVCLSLVGAGSCAHTAHLLSIIREQAKVIRKHVAPIC